MSTAPKKKILIADDEPDILEILRFNLEAEGYQIEAAKNGAEAVQKAKTFIPDLIILDVMMPLTNGIQACQELRLLADFKNTLIIFLSALSDEFTEVKALESGADDFINKPIRPKILITKINALFRRVAVPETNNGNFDDLKIDKEKYIVNHKGKEIFLARKEFELLNLLASKPGKVFLRNEILSKVWGSEIIVGDRTIDVHIRKIRQKLELDCIKTVKGVGYKFQL
jgi:two-component system alkaline phosphatase synthesis response regulator PhoP